MRPSVSRRGVLTAALALPALLPTALKAAPLDKVRAKGSLRISVYNDFAPWSWSEGGRLTGIDVDIATALAGQLGVKPDWFAFDAGEDVETDLRETVWRGPLINGSVADMMMHVPYDPKFAQRQERVAIVAPYCRESFAMACHAPDVDCEVPPPQFKGQPLAVEADSIPDFYLMGGFGTVLRGDVHHFATATEALAEVAAGRADMTVASRAQAEHAVQVHKGAIAIRKGPLPAMTSPGWDVGVAVRDDSRDLGDWVEARLAAMIRDGQLPAIFARYGVTHRLALLAS